MSVATTTAIAIAGGLAAAGGVASSVIGANAAGTAANEQVTQDQNAIAEQQREFGIAQANSAPFVQAGQQSIGQIMTGLNNGTFGPGSLPALPTPFQAPTLAQAQQTPGYQFTAQQGSKGVLEGAAAAGGAISGGTLKSLDQFNTNLADTTYQQQFGNALQSYNANLAQYGTALAGQQQEFNQLLAPAALGSGAVTSINNTGTQAANSIGSLMQSIGSSQAAGTLGQAASITGGINSVTGNLSQALLLGQIFNGGGGTQPGYTGPIGVPNTPGYVSPGSSTSYQDPMSSYYQPAAPYQTPG